MYPCPPPHSTPDSHTLAFQAIGACKVVGKLLGSKGEEDLSAAGGGGDNQTSELDKDSKGDSTEKELPYPAEVLSGLSSAFSLLTFLSFSPSADLMTVPVASGWKGKATLVLFNQLFSSKAIMSVERLLSGLCTFLKKECHKLKQDDSTRLAGLSRDVFHSLSTLVCCVSARMQAARVERVRDTRLLQAIVKSYLTLSAEQNRHFTHFNHIANISSASALWGSGTPACEQQPADVVRRIRVALVSSASVFFLEGWNDVEKDLFDILFVTKSAPSPATQLGALLLLGDLLPPPLSQSSLTRRRWASLLEPLAEQGKLAHLLSHIKSSSTDVSDALIRALVRLAGLSDAVGLALLEPLVDMARAEIIKATTRVKEQGFLVQPKVNGDKEANGVKGTEDGTKCLVRLLYTLVRLQENPCCKWILNGAVCMFVCVFGSFFFFFFFSFCSFESKRAFRMSCGVIMKHNTRRPIPHLCRAQT